jgi:MoxR-like ATPase
MDPEKTPPPEKELKPIEDTDTQVSYLGVTLEKASNREHAPRTEDYKDYINDEFSLELQKKIAVSFLQGDPILIEGGTSIGKTTTVKKMCAELGWEVHYANLNGATDVEDLMGRYIPNTQAKEPGAPQYMFADGRVTSRRKQDQSYYLR